MNLSAAYAPANRQTHVGILYKMNQQIKDKPLGDIVAHQLNKVIKLDPRGYSILSKERNIEGPSIDLKVQRLMVQVPLGREEQDYVDILITKDTNITTDDVLHEIEKFYNSEIPEDMSRILIHRQNLIQAPTLVCETIYYYQLLGGQTFIKFFDIYSNHLGEPVFPMLRPVMGP